MWVPSKRRYYESISSNGFTHNLPFFRLSPKSVLCKRTKKMSDWDSVTVLRKKAPKSSTLKTESAVNQARRQGVAVDTQQKCERRFQWDSGPPFSTPLPTTPLSSNLESPPAALRGICCVICVIAAPISQLQSHISRGSCKSPLVMPFSTLYPINRWCWHQQAACDHQEHCQAGPRDWGAAPRQDPPRCGQAHPARTPGQGSQSEGPGNCRSKSHYKS